MMAFVIVFFGQNNSNKHLLQNQKGGKAQKGSLWLLQNGISH